MEKFLGRKLKSHETVHHKDSNRLNNDISNLELWAKSGAHILTIPPLVLAKCLLSARTKETVVQFLNDASKAMQQL